MGQTAVGVRIRKFFNVPYHGSADQNLSPIAGPVAAIQGATESFSVAERGFFRPNDMVNVVLENLGDTAIASITFLDSADDVTYAAVNAVNVKPAVPLKPGGRITAQLQLNEKIAYLKVQGHHSTSTKPPQMMRATFEVVNGGGYSPI